MSFMSSASDLSAPDVPPLSPGSSVSTRLQDEYDELLKFAVVVPKYDPRQLPATLTDTRESFLQSSQHSMPRRQPVSQSWRREDDEVSDATDVTPINTDRSPRAEPLPDFGGQSPIGAQGPPADPDRSEDRPHDPIPSHYLSSRHTSRSSVVENRERFTEVQGEYERVYTATVDPDVGKMETVMDQWCLDLKRNILAEFSQSKIRIVEQGRQQLVREQERHASEKMKLLDEMNSLKELLATYERSIERKDQVISNLTNALQKQKDRTEVVKTFCEWKMRHNDLKRENFCTKLAKKHHERCLSRRVWDAWHSVIETKWRVRIEKACQAKAQEVCVQLTEDYEGRISALNAELSSCRQEVGRMQLERERYEEMMKKAFMRGVCALNLEAMSIFHNQEEKENRDIGTNGQHMDDVNLERSLPEKDFSSGKSIPASESSTGKSISPRERIVTSEGSRPSSVTQSNPMVLTGKSKAPMVTTSKVLSHKVTSRVDSGKPKGGGAGSQPLAPPMSSVVVERHQPVNKQTMPHAVAGKYPRPSTAPSGDRSRKIAGQGQINVQTVKHVE
ncbi:centrosomal protein POC5-like [Dreissena polymorpha]|uniref:centrosomal protein POC5-like n=1 Tax=Dreissena polymorpha TaxID=45954 RepID=UPI0022648AF0|nr:centrosomal protein POC5-like [Dreissena polymorpha]